MKCSKSQDDAWPSIHATLSAPGNQRKILSLATWKGQRGIWAAGDPTQGEWPVCQTRFSYHISSVPENSGMWGFIPTLHWPCEPHLQGVGGFWGPIPNPGEARATPQTMNLDLHTTSSGRRFGALWDQIWPAMPAIQQRPAGSFFGHSYQHHNCRGAFEGEPGRTMSKASTVLV